MTSTLVATKLFVPRLRGHVLDRERLSARLQRGAGSKLTLISAPAGFGKTTAVAAWLAARPSDGRIVAWLSLDGADNDVTIFWTHVIAALQKVASGNGPMSILEPGQHPIEDVLTSIANALSALTVGLDLVLDDYHLIDKLEIAAGMEFLLEHLPSPVNLVIMTRADPVLPLARLRARGDLLEIRSADLRFTAAETAAYLNGQMGLRLTPEDIIAIEDRTEGWIAALQLAALSMEGRDDTASFIAGFAGNDRYVFDYLVEEVLERQPEEVRQFLAATCFMERLSGSLCDAVTGGGGGRAMLDGLHRANLFLVPLDDRREWYRYHHLFADVLLTQLDDAARGRLPLLHRRASVWYWQQGERPEAIRHALASADLDYAAELMELAIPETQKSRGEAMIRDWSRLLPDELVRTRPVLGIGLVGALASMGELDGIEDRLRDVEVGLTAIAEHVDSSTLDFKVVDQSQLPRVPTAVERYRAALAHVRGDVSGTIVHAQRAVNLAPAGDHLGRASGASLLGIAYWSGGNLEAARHSWTVGRDGLRRAGHIADALGVSIALADINIAQGRLREAIDTYVQALQVATAHSSSVLRGSADMHVGLSELHRERNELQAAHRHLLQSQELGERAGLPQHPYRSRVAEAHLRRDEGDLDAAAELLDEAVRLYVGDFFPNFRPVAAVRARLWICQGWLDEAVRWQRDAGVDVDDELGYLKEFEHITLARLLMAKLPGDEATLRLLDRLLEAAGLGGRTGSVIELSILMAVACRQSDIDIALTHLARALTLAAPEGYVRLFINEGQPMEALLKRAVKRRIEPAYSRKLLASFGPPEEKAQTHPDLIEPLSERELDVLRLLGSDLGGPEIARELMVSPNTMRTHTKNIYEKLGVNSRLSAVRRAEELGILGHRRSR